MKKLLFLILSLLFLINNVSASIIPIINDAYVDESLPNNNFGTDGEGFIGFYGGLNYIYFEIPTTPKQYIILTSNYSSLSAITLSENIAPSRQPYYDNITKTFYFSCEESWDCNINYMSAYKTTIFNQNTITWNNKPVIGALIQTNIMNEYPIFNQIIILPDALSQTGTIYFKDENINSSTYPLQNALVYINSTLFSYSDSNGNYIINNATDNNYKITVSKSGFSTKSINTYNNTENDFTLEYSKPHLSTPYIDGNFIKSNYSHNFLSLNLWENPYFVWGNYDYGNGLIKKSVCEYQNNNIFACNLISGNYKFNMSYSDIYNYNLNTYHPFLTGNRTFTTGYIFIGNDTNNLLNTYKLNPETRENTLSDNFISYLFITFLIITGIYAMSFKSKKREKKVYER